MALNEDLDLLEKSIRQLQIEWEKFFGGIERKPPVDLRTKLEGMIRRYANAEIRNNTERFRYQNLATRYQTFAELWAKRLRAMEEGRPVGLHGKARDPGPAAASLPATAERLAARGQGRATRTSSG